MRKAFQYSSIECEIRLILQAADFNSGNAFDCISSFDLVASCISLHDSDIEFACTFYAQNTPVPQTNDQGSALGPAQFAERKHAPVIAVASPLEFRLEFGQETPKSA